MTGWVVEKPNPWESPIYKLAVPKCPLTVNVTGSAPNFEVAVGGVPDLPAKFREHRCRRVLDLGAGYLRNSIALLKSDPGLFVTAVEYPECLDSKFGNARLAEASSYGSRFELKSPKQFSDGSQIYDAAIIVDVVHIVPLVETRKEIVVKCGAHLRPGGLLFLASVYGEPNQQPGGAGGAGRLRFRDGWCYRLPTKKRRTTYQLFARDYQFEELRGLAEDGPFVDGEKMHSSKHHALLFRRS
jgi:hypothetical protein